MLPLSIICVGLNHRTADVALRERFSCAPVELETLLGPTSSPAYTAVQESVLISTCNRMELYAVVDPQLHNHEHNATLLINLLAELSGEEPLNFSDALYIHEGTAAVEHLFQVAGGLDSLVLGEPQILGQVTQAFMTATDAGSIGPILTNIFRAAIRTGKRARSETAISHNPASMASVAIAQAQTIVGDLRNLHILVIGAGEMAQLALKALTSRGIHGVDIANRTCGRGEKLAEQTGGQAYAIDDLARAIAAADVVFSATAAPHAILDLDTVRAVQLQREARPLVLVDIAVPRDVDPAVALVPGVSVLDVDGLRGELGAAREAREEEVPRVEAIIAEELEALQKKLGELTVRPVIKDLHRKAEDIRRRELERTLRFLGEVDDETAEHLEHLTRALVKKLLHEPTIRLRREAGNGHTAAYVQTVRELFALESAEE